MKKILYPTVVTIGVFDGVHKGHQEILRKVLSESGKNHLKSAVVTFDPHPVKVLYPEERIPFLMSLDHRTGLIKKMGVDYCFVKKFTKEFSRLDPREFIKNILVDRLNLRILVTGGNFLFGCREKGSSKLLKKLSREFGFKYYSIPPLKIKGRYISSTRIRKAIEKGRLDFAKKLLGRPVSVLGTVVKGKTLGRKIGFPTANIDPHHEAIPPAGVYSVDVISGEKLYHGILNISLHKIIEVHILKFNKNIYGKNIEVMFKKKIRNEKKFSSLEALKRQIALDIRRI